MFQAGRVPPSPWPGASVQTSMIRIGSAGIMGERMVEVVPGKGAAAPEDHVFEGVYQAATTDLVGQVEEFSDAVMRFLTHADSMLDAVYGADGKLYVDGRSVLDQYVRDVRLVSEVADVVSFDLEEDSVGCVLMGETTLIKEGDTARRTGRIMQVPVGDALIEATDGSAKVITAVVHDADFAAQVAEMFERDFEKSRLMEEGEYEKKPFWFRLGVRLARLTSPVQ